jgi:hypothetical protein
MGYNSSDRAKVEKEAQKNGYHWNNDHTKMIDRHGGQLKFSETGQSCALNGGHYNTVNGVKNSKKW